jgi:hypothetical protein
VRRVVDFARWKEEDANLIAPSLSREPTRPGTDDAPKASAAPAAGDANAPAPTLPAKEDLRGGSSFADEEPALRRTRK